RNRTAHVSQELRDTLDSTPLPDLPIEALRRPGWPVPPDVATGTFAIPGDEPARPPADPAAMAAAGDVVGMARAFDDAARIESESARLAVLAAWRLVRGRYAETSGDPDTELAAARLDGWLAVERLLGDEADQADLVVEAIEAGRRL